jgi:nicotinate-nucleotide adenylyltransferase
VTRLVALLGGSFDPVHNGHLALAALFHTLLQPDELRVVVAGNPWQKAALGASAEQRCAMLELAFADAGIAVRLDRQEIERRGATYSIDTLRAVRAEIGPEAALVFLMGADQLRHLDSWRDWQQLSGLCHFAVASRPGYDLAALPPAVAAWLAGRRALPQELRASPCGKVALVQDLSMDMSSTEVRAALQRGNNPGSLIPRVVLDYIQQHHLYN